MADTFFGFDTTLPDDDEFRRFDDDFDALNDETFNQAIKDDWEDGHETLVRNDLNENGGSEEEFDSDLDINDFITKFDSIDIRNDETDSRHQFQLDPSVWTTPIKPTTPQKVPHKFPAPPPGIVHQAHNSQAPLHLQQQKVPQNFILVPPQQQQQPQQSAAPKIMSLEEIERNLITQQQQFQQHKIMRDKLAALQAKVSAPSPIPQQNQQQQQQQQQPQQQQQQQQQSTPQQRKVIQNQQQQQTNQQQQTPQSQQQGIIFPPSGFPPIPPHLQGPNFPAKFNPMMHPMMNNFHPNFAGALQAGLRQGMQPQMNRLPPHLINMQANPLLYQSQAQNTAQFNQRLVQEIQQNHPMLNHVYNVQQRQQQQQMHHNNNNNRHQKYNNHSNGKPEDYDEYANLMSNRDKQFLITIQLMQLNTETPYFDDFYYTMYKERMRMRGSDKESQAHRDNQMNHPFTQPKGHAQMLLRQFNNINKNGFQNQKNGGRERRNSESSQKNEKEPPTPRTYTPLQFENSLGKLQCGSVTAPRKIIDMEIVAMAEIGNQTSATEFTLQKKSRQILMHIETLYKIVLKLEDFHIPLAISATVILKEKREKQRLQMEMEGRDEDESSSKSSMSINEPESQTELMIKLLSMVKVDKIPGMMTVRKGRTLLKRIMPLIKDHPVRWDIWNAIFLSLSVFKRDKLEEIEQSLMALYYEFPAQLQDADFIDLLKLSNNMMTSEKLLGYVNGCKFFVSSIIAMFIKCELVFQNAGDTINYAEEEQWIQFLNKLFGVVNADRTVDAQILSSANIVNRDKNDNVKIIRTVMDHLQRFKTRFTSDEDKLVKLLGIQYDVK